MKLKNKKELWKKSKQNLIVLEKDINLQLCLQKMTSLKQVKFY